MVHCDVEIEAASRCQGGMDVWLCWSGVGCGSYSVSVSLSLGVTAIGKTGGAEMLMLLAVITLNIHLGYFVKVLIGMRRPSLVIGSDHGGFALPNNYVSVG